MTDKYRTVLLLGAPGAGKGTQGKILGTIPGFHHCSCGDVFRSIDITSDLGKKFYEHSSRGELVPDDLTVALWAQNIKARHIIGEYKPARQLLILDGIPRTVRQAELLKNHIEVLTVVHLSCEDENAMFERLRKRALKENRIDDADEKVIRRRWSIYEKETRPILDFYPSHLLYEVNSIGSPAMVLMRVLDHLAPLQDKHFTAPAL